MPASSSTANGTTTVTFTYAAPTAKVLATFGKCAERVWDDLEDTILFENATNQQKLNVVYAFIKNAIMNEVKAKVTQDNSDATDIQSEIDIANDYEVGN